MALAIHLGLFLLAWSLAGWLLSLWLRRMDIADVAWGLGFMLVAAILWAYQTPGPLGLMVFVPVVIWGLRLAWHIGRRMRGKPEDFRYRQWREEWGHWMPIRSLLQVFLLQTALLAVIAAPLLLAGIHPEARPGPVAWAALGLWLAGFLFQAMADAQLARFRRRRRDRDEVLQEGLWRYSRHPNYFGEILMWWGLGLMVLPLPWGWLALISPLTITWLLVRVSGVPMLERRYDGNAGYAAYRARTPALVPWGLLWPKRRS
jgi:steroid 5-alpha reductase family enzyme